MNPTQIESVPFQSMPHCPHVCFLCQAQVQEDVPEVSLAAAPALDLFLLLLIPPSFPSPLL